MRKANGREFSIRWPRSNNMNLSEYGRKSNLTDEEDIHHMFAIKQGETNGDIEPNR